MQAVLALFFSILNANVEEGHFLHLKNSNTIK
jgi:hypothetical protein